MLGLSSRPHREAVYCSPGWHWLYHSLNNTHDQPDTQEVSPVYERPPHWPQGPTCAATAPIADRRATDGNGCIIPRTEKVIWEFFERLKAVELDNGFFDGIRTSIYTSL